MNNDILLGKAIRIASEAHEGQFDKGGKPYILHPLWVMDRVHHLGPLYMMAGVMHDVIEDSDMTIDILSKNSFPIEVLKSLELLDFRGTDYISRIRLIFDLSNNGSTPGEIAKEVKLRDLEHNSKITRIKGLRSKDFKRIEKYHKAYNLLKK